MIPGFDPGFHNGYEVVKVTINYASNECLVSLHPLAIEIEEIGMETYFRNWKHTVGVLSQKKNWKVCKKVKTLHFSRRVFIFDYRCV
ncbi:hypothetical protein RCO48_20295 [Peribacillus frigoritolerans]|nr:hypothetical protein [Peribacillus frigoritolerans]